MKTSLKKWISAASNFIALIPSCSIRQMLSFFLELNSKGLYKSSGKDTYLLSCVPVLDKTEIRHFHVVVVERRLRNVQKSVMHVQSCCSANLTACLHGGGGLQIGEITRGGSPHLSCERLYGRAGYSTNSGLPHLPVVPYLHVNRP